MGVLRRRRAWGDLVTAVVGRKGDSWTISLWIDGRLPSGGDYETLDELIRVADSLVADRYPAAHRRETAELQYAICPWVFKGDPEAMFDVRGSAGHLVATDIIADRRLEVRGRTADELVERAPSLLDVPPRAMFRWIKKISELNS